MTQGGDAGLFYLENVLRKRLKMHGGAGGGVGGNMGGGEKDPWEVNKIKVLIKLLPICIGYNLCTIIEVCVFISKQLNYNAPSTELMCWV